MQETIEVCTGSERHSSRGRREVYIPLYIHMYMSIPFLKIDKTQQFVTNALNSLLLDYFNRVYY